MFIHAKHKESRKTRTIHLPAPQNKHLPVDSGARNPPKNVSADFPDIFTFNKNNNMARLIIIILLLFSLKAAFAQSTELNIPYILNGGQRQQLDLYVPAAKSFITIMYVHEGSLLGGDKADSLYPKIARK